LRPAHFVGGGGSNVLERNALQRIDAKQKKYPDCGKITGDIRDALEEFEAGPLVSSLVRVLQRLQSAGT
jgi:hypothetical protein